MSGSTHEEKGAHTGPWDHGKEIPRIQGHNTTHEIGSLLCGIENIYKVLILRDSGKDSGGEEFW